MDQDDSAGADPQQTIRDLEQQAAKDKEALDKLLVAYQAQEADIAEMKAQVETLNRELIDKETEKEGINNLLNNLRRQKDEMEVELAKANTKIPFLESKLDKTEEMLEREKARLGQVLTVAEEIEPTPNRQSETSNSRLRRTRRHWTNSSLLIRPRRLTLQR